jgi:HSP20 family protein
MAQVPTTQRSQSGTLTARRNHPLERLQRDFDTLFDRLWRGGLTPFDQDFGNIRVWDFDVTENDREIMVRAEVPGFEPNELDVQLDNDVLTIKAEKEKKDNGREEYRSFFRSVTLPPGIDGENAKASFRNGVLELHIPRKEGAQPKRINVQQQQGESGRGSTGQQAQQPSSIKAGGETSQSGSQGQQSNTKQAGGMASDKAKK